MPRGEAEWRVGETTLVVCFTEETLAVFQTAVAAGTRPAGTAPRMVWPLDVQVARLAPLADNPSRYSSDYACCAPL
jgi:hypothetical protein